MSQRHTPDQKGPGAVAKAAVVLTDPKLAACRDMALQLLIQSFDGFFNRLEEEFLDLAEKSVDRGLRDTYFAARAETKNKREVIKAEFRQRFLEAFNSRLTELSSAERKARAVKLETLPAELSLVANDEYEENLTASNMVSAFKQKSGDDLKQLESRMARLIPRGEDEEAANPISPEAICEAMLGACRQIESGVDARIVALRSFEQQLTTQVASIYRQVNEFLVQQNVQPVVYRLRPRGSASSPASDSAAPVVPSASEVGSQAEQVAYPAGQGQGEELPAGMVQMTIPAALASHLELLLSGQMPAASLAAPQRRPSEITFLDQLQHRLPDTSVVPEGTSMHPARDNLVSLLQNTQWGQGLQQMDAMTLNLVALLFDRLFEDSRLPDAIKGLIGRLQIPVLKVALVDNTFFARKNHPARLLLDRLAESAVDWHDGADAGNPRFDKLSAIVSWVVVNFEDDVSIFDQALADLESFLLAEADAAASQVLEDTEELAASELSELGMATADSVVKGRMFKREVPPLVSEFVQQWWIAALARAYGPAGENEPRFVTYIAALDDLLWSVEPKHGPEARLQLVNRLPGMLKTLEDGAELAGMLAEDCKAFFSELVHCHAAAIRNGMRPPAPVSVAYEAPAPVVSPEPVSEEPAEELLPSLPADEFPKRWEWVNLLKNDGTVHKMRLTWVSPQGTRFLFTNRDGENGHTFNRAEVEKLMHAGRMTRELLSDSLTDAVFDQLRRALVA